jgi:tetratricopeptide (TPR) repeat protein
MNHEGRWLLLHTLGFALDSYYGRTGDLDSLEEAISMCREALKLRPSPHLDRSDLLAHWLAHLFRTRYRRSKAMADLEEAISLSREAVELRPPQGCRIPLLLARSVVLTDTSFGRFSCQCTVVTWVCGTGYLSPPRVILFSHHLPLSSSAETQNLLISF